MQAFKGGGNRCAVQQAGRRRRGCVGDQVAELVASVSALPPTGANCSAECVPRVANASSCNLETKLLPVSQTKIAMHVRSFYLVAILASFHAIACAQVFKCKTATRGPVFQGTPCQDDGDAQGKKQSAAVNRSAVPIRRVDGPGANWDVYRSVAPVDRSGYAPLQVNPAPVVVANPPPSNSAQTSRPNDVSRHQDPRQAQAVSDMIAATKQQNCDREMQQLDVVKNGRIIYSNDKQGDRRYIEDADRPAKIAAAQRRVADACN